MTSILITGGTGLIGKRLSFLLTQKGYNVLILSRNNANNSNIYKWNIDDGYIEEKAIYKADYIIHLAGAGIADKRWTKRRKHELLASRINSTNLLYKKIKELNPKLKGFIAASGIGFYGATTTSKIYQENDSSGTDFLSNICVQWEKASLQFKDKNIRTVIFRTGVVLTKKGGAFEKITKPIKMGLGAALGSGNQYMPWIHIDDLCEMYIEAIKNNELNGVYNAVAPTHVTNKTLSKKTAKELNKPFFMPNIPSFVFKIIFGKMAVILLEGSRVSSEKIINTGFKFKYPTLKKALKQLIN
jgi:uncharacterized protein